MIDQAAVTCARLRRLTVRSAVRKFALRYAASTKKFSTGKPRFTRVSVGWLDRIEAQFTAAIRSQIDRLPNNGRTIT